MRVDVLRGLGGRVAEDVRVAVDQLLDEAARDVVHVKRLLGILLRDARVEDDLEQDVAQLLAQFVPVAVLDRLDQFVRLLDRVLGESPVRLARGPRALPPDAVHDLDQVEQPGPGQVVRTGQQLQVRHGEPARAAETGQAVRQAGVALAADQNDDGPAARALRDQFVGGGRGVLGAYARLAEVGQLRVVRVGDEDQVGGVQRLPGRPGQQARGDPVAGGEQNDAAGVGGGLDGGVGGFGVHRANLPPAAAPPLRPVPPGAGMLRSRPGPSRPARSGRRGRAQAPARAGPRGRGQAPAGCSGAASVRWVIQGAR
ncbi:hypothetical protein SCALM49S_00529 [Streptomyces californicus]